MRDVEAKTSSEDGPLPKALNQSRWFWFATVGCFALFVSLIYFFSDKIDVGAFHRWVEAQNGLVVFALMCVLPLFWFPASVVFVVAGAKFGPLGGLVVVSFSIAVNLLGSYWITHSFVRKPVEALFRRTKYRLPQVPQGEHNPVVLLTALVPGLPYAAKNYLLALGGVPFKPYFWVALPAHVFHASLGIFFGGLTAKITAPRIIFLIVYALFIAVLSRHVVLRLKARKAAAAAAGQSEAEEPGAG